MKPRPDGFLAGDFKHYPDVLDYVSELHAILWLFVRTQMPGASGHLDDFLDRAIAIAEQEGADDGE